MRPITSDHRGFCRTTNNGVRDFSDISGPFAAPDRSQQATTAGRIEPKSRELRDKFESMLCPKIPLHNNDLSVAVQAVCSEPVSGAGAVISLLNREKTGNFCRIRP